MSEQEIQESGTTGDSHLDAFAAVALIFIAVLTAVFWLTQR